MSTNHSAEVDPKVKAKREQRLRWYYRNREHCNQKNKEYCQANKKKRNERQKKRYHAESPEKREERRQRTNAWRHKNPEKMKRVRKSYRERQREHLQKVSRRNHLKRKFKMTVDQFMALLDKQGGRCAICLTKNPAPLKVFTVDHDHKTDEVRGLLCFHCNAGIGHLKDDPRLLRAAVRYLKNYAASHKAKADSPAPCPSGLFG